MIVCDSVGKSTPSRMDEVALGHEFIDRERSFSVFDLDQCILNLWRWHCRAEDLKGLIQIKDETSTPL
jgi:hypothetical protein